MREKAGRPDPLPIPAYAEQLLTGADYNKLGLEKYVVMIRDVESDPLCSAEDPQRRKPKYGDAWRKELKQFTAEEWLVKIVDHMADGEPRTFNRIMVELFDRTADFCCGGAMEIGLWMAVKEGFLHFNTQAPVYFWRV